MKSHLSLWSEGRERFEPDSRGKGNVATRQIAVMWPQTKESQQTPQARRGQGQSHPQSLHKEYNSANSLMSAIDPDLGFLAFRLWKNKFIAFHVPSLKQFAAPATGN